MRTKRLLAKHRISNGYDWKKAKKIHKAIYVGAIAKETVDEKQAYSYEAGEGKILVIVDGMLVEMNREMVVGLLKYGVFRAVGKLPLDIELDAGIPWNPQR